MNRITPLISIVIPTFNRKPLLVEAIDSVVAQTYSHWELIIVDDGSVDKTSEYLSTLSDPRVRHIHLPHTGNIAAVRNAGAYLAHGSYLAFMDSDDLWMPEKLEIQIEMMLHNNVQWSYTRYQHINETRVIIPPRAGEWKPLSGNIALPMITTEAAVAISTLVIKTSLFTKLGGFDEDVRLIFREDYDMFLRLALMCEVLAVPHCLVKVREHPQRATRNLADVKPFVITAQVYDKLIPKLLDKDLRRAARLRRGYHLAEAGVRYFHKGALGSAVHCFIQSLLDGDEFRHWASSILRGIGLKR